MTTKIINTEVTEATEFSMKTTVIELDRIPSKSEKDQLFGDDESIILIF